MRNSTINVAGLTFLLADPNPHASAIVHSILRGFGATRIIEVRTCHDTMQVLADQKVDMLLCEPKLPDGGLGLVRAIRKPDSPCRTMPILVISGDTRIAIIKDARDSGANMLVAKPMSPATLFDRLTWVAVNPRKFVETSQYFGPDRRFKIEGLPDGVGRRGGDSDTVVGDSSGPALSQNEIDNLLQEAKSGSVT